MILFHFVDLGIISKISIAAYELERSVTKLVWHIIVGVATNVPDFEGGLCFVTKGGEQ